MFDTPLYPKKVDVVLLTNVLHDRSEEDIFLILKMFIIHYNSFSILINELFVDDS